MFCFCEFSYGPSGYGGGLFAPYCPLMHNGVADGVGAAVLEQG